MNEFIICEKGIVKMNRLIIVSCIAVLFGCASHSSERVVEHHFTSPPPQDMDYVVSPGWHEGKTYTITQNLKPTPVKKRNINQEENPADHPKQ